MYPSQFISLNRGKEAIYVQCPHPSCMSIAMLGIANGNENQLISEAAEIVHAHRASHGEHPEERKYLPAEQVATWGRGDALNYPWMGRITTSQFKLVDAAVFRK